MISSLDAVSLSKALAAMTDERDHYKRELGLTRDQEVETRVGSRLGLSKREQQMLMILYARQGRNVTRAALFDAMYAGIDEPDGRTLDAFVMRLRKKLGADCIETTYGRGWMLTAAGVAVVEQAMMVAQ